MSSGQIALSRLLSRPLLCSFRFLSPRSRLSVRCLVFKELFDAAVAATRPKFYFISFRLVKSFSKNFCFSFRSSLLRAIKKSRCSRLIFLLPVKRGCELWSPPTLLSNIFCAFFPIFFRIYSNTLFLFSFYFLFHRLKKRTWAHKPPSSRWGEARNLDLKVQAL